MTTTNQILSATITLTEYSYYLGQITRQTTLQLADYTDGDELREVMDDWMEYSSEAVEISTDLPYVYVTRHNLPTDGYWEILAELEAEQAAERQAEADARRQAARRDITSRRTRLALVEVARLQRAALPLTAPRVTAICRTLRLGEHAARLVHQIAAILSTRHSSRKMFARNVVIGSRLPRQMTHVLARACYLDAAAGAHLNRIAAR